MKKYLIFCVIIAIALLSYFTPEILMYLRLKDMDNYIKNISHSDVYNRLRSNLADTIKQWNKAGVRYVYIIDKLPWKVDETVLFNPDTTKALMFLIIYNSNNDQNHHTIKFVYVKRQNNNVWKFYFGAMPVIGVIPDSTVRGAAVNFQKLQKLCREEVIDGGYYHTLSWIVDKEYINNWEKDIDLEEQQKLFMEQRLVD